MKNIHINLISLFPFEDDTAIGTTCALHFNNYSTFYVSISIGDTECMVSSTLEKKIHNMGWLDNINAVEDQHMTTLAEP